ncbi:BN159_2729 family protein [Streptomyces bungoensis]|uniref:BN159_2729 family protein n=1 Tax=Streptomyces bungoensis TaxID=285568 RepID=UPI0034059982
MTIADGSGTDVERELTARLRELARVFIADLQAQGRLVETGGADTLQGLGQQNLARRRPPESEPADPEAGSTETDAPPATGATPPWEPVTTPHAGGDTPGLFTTPRPPHIPGVSEPHPASTHEPDAPATTPVPAQLPAALEPAPSRSAGAQEPRTDVGGQTQPPAAVAAARLRAENNDRLEVTRIASDHERVTVHIHAVSLGDWEYWLNEIGAPLNVPTHRSGWAQTAIGHLDGVEVHLTADAVPRLLEEAAQLAAEPFLLWGRVYDLAVGYIDRLGQIWHHHSRRGEDGVPLFTLGGSSGTLHPLPCIVMANGPLTPVVTPGN